MPSLRPTLVAADFSEASMEALRLACSLALENKTKMVVLHVIEPDWVKKKPEYLGPDVDPPAQTECLPEFLSQRLREVYVPIHSLEVEYLTSEGPAATEIVRVADAMRASLIAMGTHGQTGLRRLLTGSVAATVLETAHCSVLAVRSDRAKQTTGSTRVIVHPTDFSKASEPALAVARSLARDHHAQLIVLHVAPVDIYREGTLMSELDPREYQHALDAIRRRIEGPDHQYPVETQLKYGSPAEEIVHLAHDVRCNLIVMGTHGRTGLARVLLGNTAASVLPRADCPVLVVKPFQPEHKVHSEPEDDRRRDPI